MATNYFTAPVFTEYVPETGLPAEGYQLEFWLNNTRNTLQPVYDGPDIGGAASALAQPIVLNASGRPPNNAAIWLDPSLVYAVTLKKPTTEGSAIVWESDDIEANIIDETGITAERLRLQSSGGVSPTGTDHPLQCGPTDGFNVRFGVNAIQAVNTGVATGLVLNPAGGNVVVGDPDGYHITFDTDGATDIQSANGGSATPLFVNGQSVVTEESGDFSAVMIGGTSAGSVTLTWYKRADLIAIEIPVIQETNPDTDIFRLTGTPLPLDIRPDSNVFVPMAGANIGVNRPIAVRFTPAGRVDFFLYDAASDRYLQTGWTDNAVQTKEIYAMVAHYTLGSA